MTGRGSTATVLGIGNAIVDVLAHTDDAFLEREGMIKGSMALIDAERAERLYQQMGPAVECSGGSAANTIAALTSLGGSGAYIGKVRDDVLGGVFRHDIRAAGVRFETAPSTSGPPTARCLIFVTPDGQRTMQTYLGASATLAPADVDADSIALSSIVFLEGYLWDPQPAKDAFLKAARLAHAAGRRVALSLSDPFCVERHRAEFRDLVEHHVDVLFANEAEVVSLYETAELEIALQRLQGKCDLAVVTRGRLGSLVLSGKERIEVRPEPVERVVDTTGAGDLYAGGFLYGLMAGHDLATCGRVGSIVAAEIIGQFGARSPTPLREVLARRVGTT